MEDGGDVDGADFDILETGFSEKSLERFGTTDREAAALVGGGRVEFEVARVRVFIVDPFEIRRPRRP